MRKCGGALAVIETNLSVHSTHAGIVSTMQARIIISSVSNSSRSDIGDLQFIHKFARVYPNATSNYFVSGRNI